VFGIVGSLAWNKRYAYCYGAELVRAVAHVSNANKISILICGGGDGFERLKELANGLPPGRVHLTGAVSAEQVNKYLSAMDIASLPQSVDGVGSFRYTTKLSEILALGLPVVTGQIPLSYDLDDGWLWRLPGPNPWSDEYITALAEFMSHVSRNDVETKARAVPQNLACFEVSKQIRRTTTFISDILASRR
jgi:glycosyltransferase involved in cell wall biosynthesis